MYVRRERKLGKRRNLLRLKFWDGDKRRSHFRRYKIPFSVKGRHTVDLGQV